MFPVRIATKTREALDIVAFTLVDPLGLPLPHFTAGSHIDVEVRPGLVRQYSLCNAATERDRYVIAVLREPASRGGSVALHDALHPGDTLMIGAPRNHFPLAAGVPHSLLLGGGIGITPLLCMAEHLAAEGAQFTLHYCARSRDRAAFIERLRAAPFAASAHFHYDDQAPEQRLALAQTLAKAAPGTHLYACGPAGFLDAVRTCAAAAAWPEASVHFEYFHADVPASSADHAFDVRIASTGAVVRVPADRTVAIALLDAGIDLPLSCEEGVCGTCLTGVLDGIVDHRDHYLTKDERAKGDQFLPCCSRAKGPLLVLDL